MNGGSLASGRLAPAVVAGWIGGAVVGVTDAALGLLGPVEMRAAAAVLVGLGGALGAAAGALLVVLHAAVSAALSRLPAAGLKRRPGPWAAVLLAAAPVTHAAFALFAGPRASALAGRHYVSLALVALGLVAVFLIADWLGVRLARIENSAGGRRQGWRVAGALTAAAVLIDLANRRILPRLYPWFHLTLAVCLGVVAIAAARFALATRAPRSREEAARGRLILLAGAVGTALVLAGSLTLASRRQTVLFVAHERTLVAAPMLRAIGRPLLGTRLRGTASRSGPSAPAAPPVSGGPRLPGSDVVLITVDALRADHLGVYGHARARTPSIDALARQGVRFERAYAQAPHTSFSVASLLTGTYYASLTRLGLEGSAEPLSLLLRRQGWKTAAFYPPAVFFVDGDKLQRHASNHFHFEHVRFDYSNAQTRLAQVRAFFEQQKPDRAFVWVHFFEPHEPYETCPGRSFGSSDVDRYDSEIACVDAAVGGLLAYLERQRPGAIVILTADHGEEFGEHGGRYHGSTLYDEQIRVPLIVRFPGVSPHVVAGQVQLIDLPPTILGLLGLAAPAGMRGTDLRPWLAAPPEAAPLPPAFAEFEYKRMVVVGSEKLICDMNWGVCAWHDLRADPGEKANLVDRRPAQVAVLRGHLDRWLDGHTRPPPGARPPLADAEVPPRALERARLGDLGVVTELAAIMGSRAPLPIRREAARLLVTRLPRRPETRAQVLHALSADDPQIRDWAALAATRLGHGAARSRARAILRDGRRDQEIRLQAALALALVDDRSPVPFLTGALDSCGSVELCRQVILGLGRLRDRRATGALVEQLGQIQNRREVVNALGEIGDRTAVPALAERLLQDEFVPVRAEAATALGKVGGPGARKALVASLARDRDPIVLEAARQAVEALDAPAPKRASSARRRPPTLESRRPLASPVP
jgi:arylsulfatase A-like enzyme